MSSWEEPHKQKNQINNGAIYITLILNQLLKYLCSATFRDSNILYFLFASEIWFFKGNWWILERWLSCYWTRVHQTPKSGSFNLLVTLAPGLDPILTYIHIYRHTKNNKSVKKNRNLEVYFPFFPSEIKFFKYSTKGRWPGTKCCAEVTSKTQSNWLFELHDQTEAENWSHFILL